MSTSTKQYGETGVIHTGSNNASSSNVPDWTGLGLSRWDLTPDTIARFQAKFTKSDGCWLWQASRYPRGYGQFVLPRDEYGTQPRAYAHRVAYVLAYGDIPPGFLVMHSCDTPPCVNPAHLVLGTQADNMADAKAKGRLGGPRPSRQKISDAQVDEIRASTEKYAVLAQRYGVSVTCISHVKNGSRRRKVT